MTKKKWAILFFCILLIAGYLKFFYKTYSQTSIAKNTDCIIALDVKRVTNTVIWNVITTPGLWKNISFTSSEEISWKDMVKIPDYIFAFHMTGQPANAWYAVFDIKNEDNFNKGLKLYHFEKRSGPENFGEYFSTESGIDVIRVANTVLIGNLAVQDKKYIRQAATELFSKKQFASKETISKNIKAKSHLSIQVLKNDFLQEAAVIKANFNKYKINFEGSFKPRQEFSFSENNFSYSDSSLCSLGFTQPSEVFYRLISDTTRSIISKAINFNIDSFLLPNNSYYNLDLSTIKPRTDSAISYSYDDNFNPVEKIVVNKVQEPLFNLSVKGEGIANIYSYWKTNGKLEKTSAGDLFLPMPLVRSYCQVKSGTELSVESGNYQQKALGNSIKCIFFIKIVFTAIPEQMKKYLSTNLQQQVENLETLQLVTKKRDGNIILEGHILKKKNDLPFISW